MTIKGFTLTFLRSAATSSKKLLVLEELTSEVVLSFLAGGKLLDIVMLFYKSN